MDTFRKPVGLSQGCVTAARLAGAGRNRPSRRWSVCGMRSPSVKCGTLLPLGRAVPTKACLLLVGERRAVLCQPAFRRGEPRGQGQKGGHCRGTPGRRWEGTVVLAGGNPKKSRDVMTHYDSPPSESGSVWRRQFEKGK